MLSDKNTYMFDEETMVFSVNHGSGGLKQYSMSKMLSDIYCFEPYELMTPCRIYRWSHFYRWFGYKTRDPFESLYLNGIAVKVRSLSLLEYECFMRTPYCSYNEYLHFVITEYELEERLINLPGVHNFIFNTGVYLCDFKRMEIAEKLLVLSSYYDLIDFINDYEYVDVDDAKRIITKNLRGYTDAQYHWSEMGTDQRIRNFENKLQFEDNNPFRLMFISHEVFYTYPRFEFNLYFKVHSAFSIEVYLNAEVIYKDGSREKLKQIKAETTDNHFEFFDGNIKVRCKKGKIWDIDKIVMTLTTENALELC